MCGQRYWRETFLPFYCTQPKIPLVGFLWRLLGRFYYRIAHKFCLRLHREREETTPTVHPRGCCVLWVCVVSACFGVFLSLRFQRWPVFRQQDLLGFVDQPARVLLLEPSMPQHVLAAGECIGCTLPCCHTFWVKHFRVTSLSLAPSPLVKKTRTRLYLLRFSLVNAQIVSSRYDDNITSVQRGKNKSLYMMTLLCPVQKGKKKISSGMINRDRPITSKAAS